jgi:DNA-binding MarR family transcriptional regulator
MARPRRTPRAATAAPITHDRLVRIAEFRAALRLFDRHVEQAARRHGLTPQRFLLLLQIEGTRDGAERPGVGEIADRLQLSPNGVTELIDRAVRAGLVVRKQSAEDARVVHPDVTDEGRRRLHATLLEAEAYRRELRVAFDRLAERFEEAAGDGGGRGGPEGRS